MPHFVRFAENQSARGHRECVPGLGHNKIAAMHPCVVCEGDDGGEPNALGVKMEKRAPRPDVAPGPPRPTNPLL